MLLDVVLIRRFTATRYSLENVYVVPVLANISIFFSFFGVARLMHSLFQKLFIITLTVINYSLPT